MRSFRYTTSYGHDYLDFQMYRGGELRVRVQVRVRVSVSVLVGVGVGVRVRERVQISASGHTDADQLGTDFFRFR